MRIELKPCPFCGGAVDAMYEGSSDWVVECKTCDEDFNVTIWVRASSAEWDADENAEWNKMARIWNRRASPSSPVDAGAVEADEQLLTACVSRDCKVVGIDHQTDADWSDIRQAHIVLRDWLNERLEHQDLCPAAPREGR